MDSVKSFFGGSNKANNLGNHQQPQQNGHTNGISAVTNRWSRNWNSSAQHTETSSSNSASIQNINHASTCNAKRKDSDNYFYIMWHA